MTATSVLLTLECLLTVKHLQNSENVEEYIDNVQVEVDSRKDVLLRADCVPVISPNHHLGVYHQVGREHKSSEGSINRSQNVIWENDGDYAENKQADQ